MTRFSFHCSQEQFAPGVLLDLIGRAERAGFDAGFTSDHAHPWAESQGQSGFAWSWLGAAMARTERLTFGAISVPGGWRYNPAVLAQAVGTLGQMFPGRLPWIALGSGQLLNEHVTGEAWPDKAHRNERLREGAEIMRALLAGEAVTRRGLVTTVDARVWSRPETPTLLMGAATTEATAAWCGGWADGLLTVCPDAAQLDRLIDAFRGNGGDNKPLHLKVDLSWAPTREEALAEAHAQWRFNAMGSGVNWDIRMPEDFEVATRFVRPEDMGRSVLVVSDVSQLTDWLAHRVSLGLETINLHNVGRNQAQFIDMAGERLLPQLR
ncbi:TIGR03885 family FMN-dependent LLM class oxidoreductase [Rhizosaccharibacter radicis]|uniref:TIGR03885 family FMN-dependent LLM class oxidoreductase n=1 Tax=Rhizosaccharibacter radicis TaxID=2782605 RepID=A0ABT1VXT2_9PROT|nr:TIGR03885 family FMN-dependent LLM class oxidoreductase [Acetobacteraceae bacterium KSS12]